MKIVSGSSLNHPNTHAVNAKKLCGVCTKARHEKSAESKGFTIKKKDDVKKRKQWLESGDFRQNTGTSKVHANKCRTILQKNEKKIDGTFKKAKINPISKDKAAEIALLGAIKKQKIEVQGKVCEMCGKHGEAKIVKFKNFDEIMDRLKSLDEGKYWKLKHKIDEYNESLQA